MTNNDQNVITNPTKEQLKTLKMIVYLFENKNNGKKYIGQTKNSLKKRYRGNKTHIFGLALKKYGWENFNITILKHSLATFEEMDYWENYYIKEFNSVAPNGYNIQGGGQNVHVHSSQSIEKMRKSSKRIIFKIKNLYSGEIIQAESVMNFCKIHNLTHSEIRKVLNGRKIHHEGWGTPETEVKLNFESKDIHCLMSPEGIIFNFTNQNEFCNKHGLSYGSITKILNRTLKCSSGWKLPETNLKEIWIENSLTKQKFHIIECCNRRFLKENPSITKAGLSILLTGKRSFYKHWLKINQPIDYQI